MEIKITYTSNKNAYAKVGDDGILKISIPKRLKGNKKFEEKLIEKGKLLVLKNQKREKIDYFGKNYVMLFGNKIENNGFGDLKEKEKNYILNSFLLEYANPLLEKYSEILGKKIKDIKVKNLKSKWGSCSGDQKIVLNQKLVHIDKIFLEYVVIHECCHLVEKNHSKNFWKLVEKFMPDYKIIRKNLKKYKF